MKTCLLLLIFAAAHAPWLRLFAQAPKSCSESIKEFENTRLFWRQLESAKKITALCNAWVLPQIEPALRLDDRHLRGNAAFVFAALGDSRGFKLITSMLNDRSARGEGQGIPNGPWSLPRQIEADRYYAVHLLGELKDKRAVPALASLLEDADVNYKVAWALGEIGGDAAVQCLIGALRNRSSDVRAIAAESLGKLKATRALPALRALVSDAEKTHFGALRSVSDAAREAIAKIDGGP